MKIHTFNSISFSENGITIPENQSFVIEGKISNHIDRKILVEEDGGYFFKFDDEQFYLKSFYNLRTRKYTIKFVGNRKYSFDFSSGFSWSQELYFPILQFKNLDSTEYHEMLQMLKEIKAVTDTRIKEAEDMDLDQHQGKITNRYAYMGLASAFALVLGFIFFSIDSPFERTIIVICNILNIISFIGNCIMMFIVNKLVDFEKVRKLYISQYIEAIFVVLVFSIVFAFFLRPN